MDLPGLPLDSLLPWMRSDSSRVNVVKSQVIYNGGGGNITQLMLTSNITRWAFLIANTQTPDILYIDNSAANTIRGGIPIASNTFQLFGYDTYKALVQLPWYLGSGTAGPLTATIWDIQITR